MYKIDTNENLLYRPGNSIQCSQVAYIGRKSKKRRLCNTMQADSLFSTVEKITQC